MAKHVPSYLERAAAEGGDTTAELLISVVDALEEQNAILDDTLHTELRRLADTAERIAKALEVIGNRMGA